MKIESIYSLLLSMDNELKGKLEQIERTVRQVRYSNSSNYLTVTDAARYLRCSRGTIYNRIKDGSIVPKYMDKVGRVMIPLDEIEKIYK